MNKYIFLKISTILVFILGINVAHSSNFSPYNPHGYGSSYAPPGQGFYFSTTAPVNNPWDQHSINQVPEFDHSKFELNHAKNSMENNLNDVDSHCKDQFPSSTSSDDCSFEESEDFPTLGSTSSKNNKSNVDYSSKKSSLSEDFPTLGSTSSKNNKSNVDYNVLALTDESIEQLNIMNGLFDTINSNKFMHILNAINSGKEPIDTLNDKLIKSFEILDRLQVKMERKCKKTGKERCVSYPIDEAYRSLAFFAIDFELLAINKPYGDDIYNFFTGDTFRLFHGDNIRFINHLIELRKNIKNELEAHKIGYKANRKDIPRSNTLPNRPQQFFKKVNRSINSWNLARYETLKKTKTNDKLHIAFYIKNKEYYLPTLILVRIKLDKNDTYEVTFELTSIRQEELKSKNRAEAIAKFAFVGNNQNMVLVMPQGINPNGDNFYYWNESLKDMLNLQHEIMDSWSHLNI